MSNLVDEHARHLRAAGCSERHIIIRGQLLRRLHDHLPMGLLFARTVDIEEFLAGLAIARSTLLGYLGHVRSFYRWADHLGYFDGDPTLTLRRPRGVKFRPKPATAEQIQAALSSPEPWHTIFALAYFEGFRAQEIAFCEREDFTQEWTSVRRAKGGDPATVPTHPYVWTLVRDRPPGRLFRTGRRGGPVNGMWISQGARRQLRRLGYKTSIHPLRHAFATDMLLAGADVRTVQECLRHASLVTTSAYLEVTSPRKRAAVELLTIPGAPASL